MGRKRGADASMFWVRYRDKADKDLPVLLSAGIKASTLSSYKTGKRFPRADEAVGIARALDTTVEYLVTGEEPLMILPADRRLLEKARRYRTLMEALDDLQVDVRNTFITAIVQTAEVCRKQHAANTANA